MPRPGLDWLPAADGFNAGLKRLQQAGAGWNELVALSRLRLDFLRTDRLDAMLRRVYPGPPDHGPERSGGRGLPVRLAVLGSSTTAHLAAPIRVAGLRRNIHVTIHESEYGQYLQELGQVNGVLQRFRPDTVLLALDARHLTRGLDANAGRAQAQAALDVAIAGLRECWRRARDLGASVIQQAALAVLPGVAGNNEHRLPGSPVGMLVRLNAALREAADADGVQILAIDEAAARDGIAEWHDPVLWHRSKQEVSPVAAPVMATSSAACSQPCRDDPPDAWCSASTTRSGAARSAMTASTASCWARARPSGRRISPCRPMHRRWLPAGWILAICSSNDEALALAAFERHPEMLLRRPDIASFVVNRDNKASNLRRIAAELRIGLDSLVLLDGRAFERNLARTALPEVWVPEVAGRRAALMPSVLAAASYFETVSVSGEKSRRAPHHATDREQASPAATADLPAWLRSLETTLTWQKFDRMALGRIVQLVNKTNQFNLTTRRTTPGEILALIDDPQAIGLQLRLRDRNGDSGIVAVVVGRMQGNVCRIETWLMSCRVLGRGVEVATLAALAAQAAALGAESLVGEYIPSGRNDMVSTLYRKLGFAVGAKTADGGHDATLDLRGFAAPDAGIAILESS